MAEDTMKWSELADSIRERAESGAASEEIHEALASALAEFAQAEQKIFRSERQEYTRWNKERNRWLRGYQKIFRELPNLVGSMREIVASLAEDDLFCQATVEVQERLRNRKEGLAIIFRMLERLPGRQEMLDTIVSGDSTKLKKLKLYAHNYLTRLGPLSEPQSIASKVNQILEEIESKNETVRDENYHIIRKLRQKTEASKQAVAGFLRDYLIPVIDGLEQGIWDEAELKKPLTHYKPEAGLIDNWFGAYHRGYELITMFLKKIGLRQLKVQHGDEFDPRWHMALGHDTSPDLEDGRILKVARSGWNYNRFSIRPAEVLVVRNEEGISDEQEKKEG